MARINIAITRRAITQASADSIFREPGFPLNEIRQILSSDDFNKIESLKAHKYMLESGLKRMWCVYGN